MSTTCLSPEHQEILHHLWSNFENLQPQTLHRSLHHNNFFASWKKRICRHPNGDITISLERSYYYSMLKNMDFKDNSNPTSTPSLRRPPVQQDSHLVPDRHHIHRTFVGMLIWAAQVRPDLQFTAKHHTRHLAAPTEWSWQHLKHTLRCLGISDSFHMRSATSSSTTHL